MKGKRDAYYEKIVQIILKLIKDSIKKYRIPNQNGERWGQVVRSGEFPLDASRLKPNGVSV
jgi:hypothetical protein